MKKLLAALALLLATPFVAYGGNGYNYGGPGLVSSVPESSGLSHPGYVSGNWYMPLPNTIVNTTAAAVAAVDTVYCEPVIMPEPFTMLSLAAQDTAAGTSANVKYALYDNDKTSHLPGKLLFSTPAVSVVGAGAQAGTIASPTQTPSGFYWACSLWTWSAAPTVYVAQNASNAVNSTPAWLLGSTSIGNLRGTSQSMGALYTTAGLYTSGFPADLTGLTAQSGSTVIPWVVWKQN